MLFGNIGLTDVYASAFIYAAANLPGNAAAYLLVDRIGRKAGVGCFCWSQALSAPTYARTPLCPKKWPCARGTEGRGRV